MSPRRKTEREIARAAIAKADAMREHGERVERARHAPIVVACRRCAQPAPLGCTYCDPCRPARLSDELMTSGDWARLGVTT